MCSLLVFGETMDCVVQSTILPSCGASWLFVSYIKKCDERDKSPNCFIHPTDWNKRTEGDTGRRVFTGIQFIVCTMCKLCWHYIFCSLCGILWPQFGNLCVALCIGIAVSAMFRKDFFFCVRCKIIFNVMRGMICPCLLCRWETSHLISEGKLRLVKKAKCITSQEEYSSCF